MKQKLVLIIISLLILTFFNNILLATPVVKTITTFSDGTSGKTFFLGSSGNHNVASLEIPEKAVITNASFDVETNHQAGNNYPARPRIDVGGDGDYEWRFEGTGYGDFGRQNVFKDGGANKEFIFNNSINFYNNTFFRMPKYSDITTASMKMNSDNTKNVTIDESPTGSWVIPFYGSGYNSIRYQALYRQSEIDFLGHIDKICYKARTTISNVKFDYFTLKFYNTTVTSLSSTFSKNNGTNQPVLVFYDNITLSSTNYNWFEIKLNNSFLYDNTNNLLVEMTWNGDNSRTINTDYGSSSTTKCVYVNSWSATSGWTTSIRNDIRFGFNCGKASNITVDVGGNNNPELNQPGSFIGTKSIPNFATELNSLISSAPISYIDPYGIAFVDIPINVSADEGGLITLYDIDIRYNLTTKAFLNPHNGNLTNELNEIIPDTGEFNITVPIVINTGSAGNIKIYNISIKYYMRNLTNDRLLILNSHGAKKICYADYENYIFMVNVTNNAGIADVNNVTFILDSKGEQIRLVWNQSTKLFSEEYDPLDLVSLDLPNCSYKPLGTDRWNLNFSVRLGWSFLDDTYIQCALRTSNNSGAWIFNYFEDVFIVENDLDLIGTLEIMAEDQGKLIDDGTHNWVHANETITWSNLTAVYKGTIDFYPDNKNFNITVIDNDNRRWANSSSSGKTFNITTISDPITDYPDIHTIEITDIPGNGIDVSDWSFTIKTDNDGPTIFAVVCHADSAGDPEIFFDDDQIIYVVWDDASDSTGSGVDRYAMEYDQPLPIAIKSSGDTAQGQPGESKFYVRAIDKVGNWGPAKYGSIYIDLETPMFSDPQPDPNIWFNSTTVQCGILVQDVGGSGIQLDSIYYRYVERGDIEDGAWNTYPTPTGETILCRQNITFASDGIYKKIQWRAIDRAGNEYMDPNNYSIKIDSTPVSFNDFSIDFDNWYNTPSQEIAFFINDTPPQDDESSGIDLNSIRYQLSTSGIDNYGSWQSITGIGTENSVECTIKPTFNEGNQNFIRFKAKDNAKNEVITQDYNVKIDLTTPTFSKPVPDLTMPRNSSHIQCNITIFDGLSKVNLITVRYSTSTNGTDNYGKWNKISIKHLVEPAYHSVTLTVNETFIEGNNNYIRWWAIDTAGNSVISDNYQIIIDLTGCDYQSPEPEPNSWINTETVTCSIIINETSGSGVDTSSIQYATSATVEDNPNNIKPWRSKDLEIVDITETSRGGNSRAESSIAYKVQARVVVNVFSEGVENYIYWRAKDLANNEYTIGGPYRVQIDLSPLVFINPRPEPNSVLSEKEQTCKITINDEGNSGVNPASVAYRYSTTGKTGFTEWSSEEITHIQNAGKDEFIVYVTFSAGMGNYIQWRGMDRAGNGPFESDVFKVIINSPPVPIISSPVHDESKSYDYTDEDDIVFNARKTTDPDGTDILDFYWESNKTGPIGYKSYFKSKLSPGMHMITLYVFDNYNHNISISVNITVGRYTLVVDTDGDGIPDVTDPDLDNDGHDNDVDAFPYNRREWLDTDNDNIGNNIDLDDDGDEYPDDTDYYPLDPKRHKKETENLSGLILGSILMMVIVIAILVAALVIRSKKKKAKEEKEKADAVLTTPPATLPSMPNITPTAQGFGQMMPGQTLPYQQSMQIPSLHPYRPPGAPGPSMAPQSVYMQAPFPMLPPGPASAPTQAPGMMAPTPPPIPPTQPQYTPPYGVPPQQPFPPPQVPTQAPVQAQPPAPLMPGLTPKQQKSQKSNED